MPALGGAVAVFVEVRLAFFALEIHNDPAGEQFHLAVRTGEIEVFAAMHDRRAAGAHMHRLRAVLVEEFDRFAELRAAHDRVIHEQKILALNEIVDRDLLHLRDLFPLHLSLRRKASRPRRRVFNIRTGEGNVALICVADRVRRAGVRQTAYVVDVRRGARLLIVLGDERTVAVAHRFYVHALVGRGRVSVIRPEERAHPHLLARLCQLFDTALQRDLHDLTGTEFFRYGVPELLAGERFKRGAIVAVPFADLDRRSSHEIARGNNVAAVFQNVNGRRTLNALLCKADALGEGILLADERREQLEGVDPAARHGGVVRAAVLEVFFDQFLRVVDYADHTDRVRAKLRADEKRLGIRVADTADRRRALHLVEDVFEFCPERGILNVMYVSL